MELTVKSVIQLFLAWAKKNRAPRTVDFYERYLGRFEKENGEIKIAELRAYHLLNFASAWHPIQAVQRCFAWAAEEAELIDRNPFRKVKRPPLGCRRRILTKAEKAKLFRAATRPFRSFLLALRETIARPQEVRELRLDHIQTATASAGLLVALRAGQAAFYLSDFKGLKRRKDTSGTRIIPITPRLGRYLARRIEREGMFPGVIYANSKGLPWTRHALRLRMAHVRKKVGLGPDQRGERVVCYSLRHTQATEACSLGIRDRILADLMGHSGTRMTARYQHLQPEHLMNAMQELHRRKKIPPPPAL